MRDVLIGHTGFVGGNLAREHPFAVSVNSTTVDDLRGGAFGTVVCAGVSAVKWKANREPEADAAGIRRLTDVLDTITAERFVLVSTIDVFRDPLHVTEDDEPAVDGLHPYGLHRLRLEQHVRERFPVCHVMRLPALFGPGLRKNIIFDLLNDNMLAAINPASRFQWYPVMRLWSDIGRMVGVDLRLLHVATEPVATRDILARLFPDTTVGTAPAPEAAYDFRTRHAAAFGRDGHYLMGAGEVLAALGDYVAAAREGRP